MFFDTSELDAMSQSEKDKVSGQITMMNLYLMWVLVWCGGLASVILASLQDLFEASIKQRAALLRSGASIDNALRAGGMVTEHTTGILGVLANGTDLDKYSAKVNSGCDSDDSSDDSADSSEESDL